tara:strand:- start:28 stop:192 length:165 start_codon:yes stop_codon:yes gene_type:complete
MVASLLLLLTELLHQVQTNLLSILAQTDFIFYGVIMLIAFGRQELSFAGKLTVV